MSGKRGRKRKIADRYPSGQLKQQVASPPAAIRRIVALAESRALDASLATQLGWLRLHRHISDKQFAAGMQFATVVGKYERAMGMPRRSTKAPSYERGFGTRFSAETDADQDAEACGCGEPTCRLCARLDGAKRRYAAAVGILRTGDPLGRLERVVIKVCVDDVAPDWSEKSELLIGLDLLVLHFRLPG